jgi:isocitrate dehydrogenase
MMKVSDPIMFGECVEVFFAPAFEKHRALFAELGVTVTNGLGDVYAKIQGHPKQAEVEKDLQSCYDSQPALAYVDSSKGITNLHVPSDVIIDASMPAALRDSGRMWTKDDELADVKFCIPDRSYATIYDVMVQDFKANGKLDVATVGATSNVGLMAQKAQEYGSHNKTFKIAEAGTVRVVDRKSEKVLFEHNVEQGDIWRMCQTKDSPVQDWVKLAVSRARATSAPALFWLDKDRAHDAQVIAKVNDYLSRHDLDGLDVRILKPDDAMRETLKRARQGQDTISVTGNVLRDYLTDLFPILELGTSAKMLSVVPLLAGGGMFETGAGGSAPKHVQQFVSAGHLRWDSLGEFLALAVSLEDLGSKTQNKKALILAECLNTAVGKVLSNGKSPKRKAGQLDNRGSHFYLALYWAEALAQCESNAFRTRFAPVAKQLKDREDKILAELAVGAGQAQEIGGYFRPDPFLAAQAMRPSAAFNSVIDALLA